MICVPSTPAKFLSHGLAIIIGGVIGLLAFPRGGRSGGMESPTTTGDTKSDIGPRVDRIIFKMREHEKQIRSRDGLQTLTAADLLKHLRKETSRKRGNSDARLAEISIAAKGFRNLEDPAAEIATAFRRDPTEIRVWAVFQSWLEQDPDAALGHLRRNWRMLDDRETAALLLERQLGRKWLQATLNEASTPRRMKRMLAAGLGRSLAWNDGLAEALAQWRAVNDSGMAESMMEAFVHEWPLDDPSKVADALAADIPKELRTKLIQSWVPADRLDPFSDTFFVFREGIASADWFIRLREALPKEWITEDLSEISADEVKNREPDKADLSTTVAERISRAANPEYAPTSVVREKVDEAFKLHPTIIGQFAEGRLSKEQLLAELRRKIPGADAYPVELELTAWWVAASGLAPDTLMKWAGDLPDSPLRASIIESGIDDCVGADPRCRQALERVRFFFGANGPTAKLRDSAILTGKVSRLWQTWICLSPDDAVRWRLGLPADDPVRMELDHQDRLRTEPTDSP